MKVLMDRVVVERGEERKFGCLPAIFCDSPCQIGALTSESF